MDFSGKCRAELTRITQAIHNRAGEEGCKRGLSLTRAGATYRVLSWLGEQALTDPLHRCTAEELYLATLATDSEKSGWKKAHESVKAASMDGMRRTMIDVREDLDHFNKTELTPYGVSIDLPKGLQKAEPSPSRKGPYGIRFVSVKSREQELAIGTEPKLSVVENFWGKLVSLEKRSRVLLVYPTDPSKLRNRHLDTRGLTAGSGEVAGAFALGGALGELWKRVDVSRSNDVTLNDMRKESCVILLGSSIKNELYRNLRAELTENACWPNQAFRFTETKNEKGEKVGTVEHGEQKYQYVVDEFPNHEIDYALISYFRHSEGEKCLIALQGISTVGTRAAAEYLSREASVRELYRKLKLNEEAKSLPSFELLLEISVREYVPVRTKYAAHVIHSEGELSSNV